MLQNQPPCNTAESVFERHDRERSAFRLLTEPEKARRQLHNKEHYAHNPWAFLQDCVFTLDQVDDNSAIKAFPTYKEYVEFLVHLWLTEKRILVPKSRRMVCSWTFISLYTHDTVFRPGRHNAFVSKKEDDSGDLISKAEFIFRHIPEWRIPPVLLPKIKGGKMSKQPPVLEFEDVYSKIQGFPQGPSQMRQFTLSGALFDEFAFWEECQASYSAAKPTLDGGGRLTGISSRSPGFFKKLVFDRIDAPDLIFPETPPAPVIRPMEGIEVWKNPKNEFVVVDLHYTADPEKRGTVWREKTKNGLPIRDFLMEYEKSWQTFEGKPVYEDYNRTIHVGRTAVEPGLPLLLGWDFGLTPAALICQLVGRSLRIHHEFVETAGSISKLGPVVWNFLMQNYLTWMHNQDSMIYSYIDPAGFQKAQTDERTCADVLRCVGDLTHPLKRTGFKQIRPGPVVWEQRRKAVENFLTRTYGEGPGLLLNETECPILIEGFGGGYRYTEKASEVEPSNITPIKNKYSHPHDALQYVAWGATSLRAAHTTTNPTAPSYSFHQSQNTTENTEYGRSITNR